MEHAVSAADANRTFSHILRAVREGQSFVVTAHGKPVAKIIPIDKNEKQDAVRTEAREALFARLRTQTALDIGPWKRDELYEKEFK